MAQLGAHAAEFMKNFYSTLSISGNLTGAMQAAITAVRLKFPHPYHWAPFILVGNPDSIEVETLGIG